ncbi:hypothetical protein [Streptomyces sp. NRRL B-1347]|uniref:hypothetical protein n=1 Tax=Streptomyces sp. NRRL B-1347 TaxID=1476877 RepID=UPI0004CAB9EF|nr:hypothetical protein [Streptomyces sp. NRRL B-1347]
MIRVPRLATAAVTALALAVGLPELAHASPDQPRAQRSDDLIAPGKAGRSGDQLPPGWELTGDGADQHLVWRAPEPVPMGDARVEFYAGDRLLGRPTATDDQRTFRLKLDDNGVAAKDALGDLQALAGGRRLDKPESAAPPRATAPAPAQLPAGEVDPGKPGEYRTVKGEYDLPAVKLPGFPAKVEMRATVVGPVGAPGKRPLALFLHGRHGTCYKGDQTGGSWPCKSGWKPIPSYQGYLHDQKLLASQGYVTVSISANGINGQDDSAPDGGAQARSSLVRQHLGRFADWAADPTKAPGAVRGTAPVDLDRVMLVGHSRGGEGVNRAAFDSRYQPPADEDGYPHKARWQIRGTVLIGPTIFGQNPDPDVPSMTLLPGCDGDVSDLQGQLYLDNTRGVGNGSALHSSVYMVGANHNFFNTEWTPGQAQAPADDDFSSGSRPDPVCSPGHGPRLKAKQQQKAGSTYIAAAARLFVEGDDEVRPLLDGSGKGAPSANPARVLTHAVGGQRTPAVVPGRSLDVTGGTLCDQTTSGSKGCLTRGAKGQSPHFAGFEVSPDPGRYALAMNWSRTGSTMSVKNARPVSVEGSDALALRLIVPPNTKGTKLDVTAVDASGHRAKLGQVRADGLPGTEVTASYWGQELRVPLKAAARAGLDLKQLKALELTSRTGSGKAWLMDAWGWRPGTAEVRPSRLARVDVGQLRVDEGDSGVRTYRAPVRVTGDGNGKVRLFVPGPNPDKFVAKTVTVRPGDTSIGVPFKVKGNKRYGGSTAQAVFAKTISGAVVGSHHGGVFVREDDPMPKVSVKPVAAKVTEGKPLKWRVSLSEAADVETYVAFRVERVSGGKELSTKDVDKAWLKRQFGAKPTPVRPLSKVASYPYVGVVVKAGKRSVELSVPTVKDRVREGQESVRLRLYTYDENWNEHRGPVFTGRVRDAG